jgi:hypothetical protein
LSGEDDVVGYASPPKGSRFRKGLSGNPSGRPRGSRDLRIDLSEELAEPTLVEEDGLKLRVSKQRAVLKALMRKALRGDIRAINTILNLWSRMAAAEPEDHPDPTADDALLSDFVDSELSRRKVP